ncbi:TrbC/VirB2 family protein [Paraburkholderia humisilvae]|uniref:Conjugal transfer protein TrbC n=1 Tax=Paraburkholderia humisilvae TaxID=627669 RepID=A0A6J5DRE7_9BURK|nr:TrbC/VirB2 family protein [Paraburkholderia humisilvae]CAB3755851.1 hypothetical protein LMG29542_02712 [Paraburkholderia humisilvae]
MKAINLKSCATAVASNVKARFVRNSTHSVQFSKRMLSPTNLYAAFILAGYAGVAVAQQAGGVTDTSAPWDSSLCGVAGWFKGTTPIAVGTIAFAAAGLGFMFGEELTGILKKVVNIVMAVCLAIGGGAFIGWVATKLGAVHSTCSV